MEYPVDVALAQQVPALPEGSGWWYEPKFDGSPDILMCLRRGWCTCFMQWGCVVRIGLAATGLRKCLGDTSIAVYA